MPSTNRIIAALPGTVLYDKNGGRWSIYEWGAIVSHPDGRTEHWSRDRFVYAESRFGPFRFTPRLWMRPEIERWLD